MKFTHFEQVRVLTQTGFLFLNANSNDTVQASSFCETPLM